MHNIPDLPKMVLCMHCKREASIYNAYVRYDLTGEAVCYECAAKGLKFPDGPEPKDRWKDNPW